MLIAADVWMDAHLLAGEHLADRGRREPGYASVLLIETPYIALERIQVLVGDEACAALLEEVDADAVLLIFRREQDDLDAVFQSENLGVIEPLGGFLDLASLEGCRVEEFARDVFSEILAVLGVLHLLHNTEELLLARVLQAFALRRDIQYDHIVAGDELLGQRVDDGGVELGDKCAHQFEFRLRIHIRLIVEEVIDKRHHELGILAGVGLVGGGLVL